MSQVRKYLCLMLIPLFLLVPVFALAATYVFPYEGFRYTQQSNETVLTQTNLQDYTAFLGELGTDMDTVLANFKSNGIVMQVIPENGGQISISVTDNPYLNDERSFDELSTEEKNSLLESFEASGIYENCDLLDSMPGAIRLTSSAMFASMPVYSIYYVTMAYGKLYTLTSTVVGREMETGDDDIARMVLSGMQMFEARAQTTEPAATAEPVLTQTAETNTSYAELQNVSGNLTIDPISSTVYEDTIILTGKTDAGLTLNAVCGTESAGQATANTDGVFSMQVKLSGLGENHLSIDSGSIHGELTVLYDLPPATVTILEPTDPQFTGESVLIRGQTVPTAIVYFTGSGINTNVTANRNGAFSIRIPVTRAGIVVLSIRSHLNGYSDYTTTFQLERVLTDREELALFRQSVVTLDYPTLAAQARNYADQRFIFRGKVMDYTDYNGQPCALVCVTNPSTGIWKDPVYIVIDSGDAPEIGTVMTFYLTGEGITLPAAGLYTRSGVEEEAPVAHAVYITSNR